MVSKTPVKDPLGTMMSTCPVIGRRKLYEKFRWLQNHLRTVVYPIQLSSNSCDCHSCAVLLCTGHWSTNGGQKETRKNMLSSGLKKARHSFSTCLLKYPLFTKSIYVFFILLYGIFFFIEPHVHRIVEKYWQLQYFSFILEQPWVKKTGHVNHLGEVSINTYAQW